MLGTVKVIDCVRNSGEGSGQNIAGKVQAWIRSWFALNDGVGYTCSAPHPPSASLIFCGGSMEGINSRAT